MGYEIYIPYRSTSSFINRSFVNLVLNWFRYLSKTEHKVTIYGRKRAASSMYYMVSFPTGRGRSKLTRNFFTRAVNNKIEDEALPGR